MNRCNALLHRIVAIAPLLWGCGSGDVQGRSSLDIGRPIACSSFIYDVIVTPEGRLFALIFAPSDPLPGGGADLVELDVSSSSGSGLETLGSFSGVARRLDTMGDVLQWTQGASSRLSVMQFNSRTETTEELVTLEEVAERLAIDSPVAMVSAGGTARMGRIAVPAEGGLYLIQGYKLDTGTEILLLQDTDSVIAMEHFVADGASAAFRTPDEVRLVDESLAVSAVPVGPGTGIVAGPGGVLLDEHNDEESRVSVLPWTGPPITEVIRVPTDVRLRLSGASTLGQSDAAYVVGRDVDTGGSVLLTNVDGRTRGFDLMEELHLVREAPSRDELLLVAASQNQQCLFSVPLDQLR